MVRRIALVGSSSTGKTTVYELLKNKLPKYEFINESTRTVKQYDFAINENGTDTTQLAIKELELIPDHKRLTITGSPMMRVEQIMEFIK